MTGCEECGVELPEMYVLTSVRFGDGVVSEMRAEYVVCPGCKEELEGDPGVEW
jgi:hypothetical protein